MLTVGVHEEKYERQADLSRKWSTPTTEKKIPRKAAFVAT